MKNILNLPPLAWILWTLGIIAAAGIAPVLIMFCGNSWIYIFENGRFTYSSSIGVGLTLLALFGMLYLLKEEGK